jgi:hypothetical protein
VFVLSIGEIKKYEALLFSRLRYLLVGKEGATHWAMAI